jgi:hypothetical protein
MKDLVIWREESGKSIADERSHVTYKTKQLKHKKNTKKSLRNLGSQD